MLESQDEFFRGVALVLADLVRIGRSDAARDVLEPYDFCLEDFVCGADEADLAELLGVLPRREMAMDSAEP